MKIYIHIDSSMKHCLSINEVEKAILNNQRVIHTCCTTFFDFDYLEKGYEVIVIGKSKPIYLSKLLDNTGGYIDKNIRREHNAHKILISGRLGI